MQWLRLRRAFLSLAVLGGLGLLAAPLDAASAAEELPQLGVTLPATSVSGLSSGAYMAGQIELAHSKDIVGAGIVAGGPFACAETESGQLFPYWPIVIWQNASQATNACMKVSWGVPDVERLAKRAKELAEDGKIDALSGLADDKVYLFSGDEDQTVQRPVVEAAKRFYAAAGVPEASVTLVERQGGHAFLTETEGTACGLSKEPLSATATTTRRRRSLNGSMALPSPIPLPSPTGKFIIFDQSPFSQGVANGLAAEGVVYVPRTARAMPAAGCISRSMAASRRGRPWAMPLSREAASPPTPTPTGW